VKTDAERNALVAEVDALVASIFGLTRAQLVHIFTTFHKGWDFKDRLRETLEKFDEI